MLAAGGDVLIHLQRECDYAMSPAQLSQRLAELTAAIAREVKVPAIAIAGGDTSSTIVKRLGFRSLSFVARAGAGVAVCRGNAKGSELDGAFLLLKGGQLGDVQIIENFG